MKSYKEKMKLRLLTARGNFNADLAHGENVEFDKEIARGCARCLSDMELMVFFYLFLCKDRNYPVNTIVKYGRRAIDRMVDRIHKDKRLSAWIDRHREWKPEAN